MCFPLILVLLKRKFYIFLEKKFIKNIIIITLFSSLIMAFDNSNRPDAGLYHLPFINILNQEKIIFGLTNLHFRFGHISIAQYFSAPFNFGNFLVNGITAPTAILYSVFILFFLNEFKSKKNYNFMKFVSFIILTTSIFGMNRYSSMGNDVSANIFFFLVIFYFLKNFKKNNDHLIFNKQIFYSTICFLCKPTMILVFIFPLFEIFRNYKIFKLSKIILFCFIFLTSWTIKNFVNSSCLLYPSEITCINTPWSSKGSEISDPKLIEIQSEAWSKDFPNRKNKSLDYFEYSENFNWLSTWLEHHFKIVLENISFFIIFFILLAFKIFNFKFEELEIKYFGRIIFFNIAVLICICFWFLKFPIYRYGESFIISALIGLFLIVIYLVKSEKNLNYKLLKYILFVILVSVIAKHSYRIYKIENKDYFGAPWPKIYSYSKENIPIKYNEIKNNKNKLIFYKPENYEICMYGKAPCSNVYSKNIIYLNYKFNYKAFELN